MKTFLTFDNTLCKVEDCPKNETCVRYLTYQKAVREKYPYLLSVKVKNGVEDVKKAKHYAKLALELQPKNYAGYIKSSRAKKYCIENGFDERKTDIIFHAVLGNYVSVIKECNSLIEELNKEKL